MENSFTLSLFSKRMQLSSVVSSYLGLPFYLFIFLTIVLLMVPVYGQIYPKRVPFLIAFRPYAGNWRFSWHIVAKSAQNKMRQLKTLEVSEYSPKGMFRLYFERCITSPF